MISLSGGDANEDHQEIVIAHPPGGKFLLRLVRSSCQLGQFIVIQSGHCGLPLLPHPHATSRVPRAPYPKKRTGSTCPDFAVSSVQRPRPRSAYRRNSSNLSRQRLL